MEMTGIVRNTDTNGRKKVATFALNPAHTPRTNPRTNAIASAKSNLRKLDNIACKESGLTKRLKNASKTFHGLGNNIGLETTTNATTHTKKREKMDRTVTPVFFKSITY